MDKKAKRILCGVLIGTVAFLTIGIYLIHNGAQSAMANESFSGLESIISGNGPENPFRILEIVPDKPAARFGYYIDGQEPMYYDNGQNILTSWKAGLPLVAKNTNRYNDGAGARTDFMNALEENLYPLIQRSGYDAPLSYVKYQESYVPKEEWTRLTLCVTEDGDERSILEFAPENLAAFPGIEKLEKGISDYVMEQVDAGTGNYRKLTAADESVYYVYAGLAKGDYELTENKDAAKSLDADVYVTAVYYTGGFTNNNWLEKYVFNQDGKLNKNMTFEMVVVTPEELTEAAVTNAGMIFLSSSFAYAGAYSQEHVDVLNYYRTSDSEYHDISWEQAVWLLSAIKDPASPTPTILDSGLLNDAYENTNIGRVARTLTAANTEDNNAAVEQIMTSGEEDLWLVKELVESLTARVDADNHYVQQSLYVIPSDKDTTFFGADFNDDFFGNAYRNTEDTAYVEAAEQEGFGEIAKLIQDENFYRKVESAAGNTTAAAYFDSAISKAICVEYIISYRKGAGGEDGNRTYRVLNVSPCQIEDATKRKIEQKIAIMTGSDGSNLEVVHMSSAEFIGIIDDINVYDLVYLDLETDSMYTDDKGRTIYRDNAMNGLVYANIGDMSVFPNWNKGFLDVDYWNKPAAHTYDSTNCITGGDTDYRYAGNDITEEKVQKLISFVKTGSPLILANNFLTTNSSGKRIVNDYINGNKNKTGYIDNCSHMYELIDAVKDFANVFTEGDIVQNNLSDGAKMSLFRRYLNLRKPQLHLSEQPKVAGFDYSKADGRTLKWDFMISNSSSAGIGSTFNCVLYLDVNADGKFAEMTESVEPGDMRITYGNRLQKVMSKVGADGKTEYYYELKPDTPYHMEYDVSDDYVGLIPWKLKIAQNGNDSRYDVGTGFYYRENTRKKPDGSTDRFLVKVLQIIGDKDSTGVGAHCTFNMEQSMKNPNSAFGKYVRELKDFELDIKTIRGDEFLAIWMADAPNNYKNNFLFDYDMVVVGFADCFQFITREKENDYRVNCYKWLTDYIAAGKSVLYTHDTTSYSDDPNNAWWGYSFGKQVGQYVGLDRYGGFSNALLCTGLDNLTKGSGEIVADSSNGGMRYYGIESTIGRNYKLTSGDMYDKITSYAKNNGYDIAYKPNSNKNVILKNVQGRTNASLDNWTNTYFSNKNVSGYGAEAYVTRAVRIANSGQILEYPYNISEHMDANGCIPIAPTHAQYFQINMSKDDDRDGESDVVVWMTLAADGKNGNSKYYDTSKNNVRSNYYIYTIGNVTYSGVGHSDVDCDIYGNGNGTIAEVQLYINTMIAAYRAGLHAPSVSLRKSADASSDDLHTIYVSADVQLGSDGSIAGSTTIDKPEDIERIYFQIADGNLTRVLKKTIDVEYYKAYVKKTTPGAVNIGTEENPVWAVKMSLKTLDSTGKDLGAATTIKSGITYSVDVPYSVLGEKEDYATFMVRVVTSVESKDANGNINKQTFAGYDTCKFQRVGLFDLD